MKNFITKIKVAISRFCIQDPSHKDPVECRWKVIEITNGKAIEEFHEFVRSNTHIPSTKKWYHHLYDVVHFVGTALFGNTNGKNNFPLTPYFNTGESKIFNSYKEAKDYGKSKYADFEIQSVAA